MFGSGPLIIRGIIEATNDLDVVSRGAAWRRALDLGTPLSLPDGETIVSCFDGAVTVGRSWAFGEFDINELIDTAEVVDGIPFVRLEHVAHYKEIAGRPKDRVHLERLAAYRQGRPRDEEDA